MSISFLTDRAELQIHRVHPSPCLCWVGQRASEGWRAPAAARRSGIEVMVQNQHTASAATPGPRWTGSRSATVENVLQG